MGSESLPQVARALQAAVAVHAVARYCRNPVRKDLNQASRCLASKTFVLPESHARGHTACLIFAGGA